MFMTGVLCTVCGAQVYLSRGEEKCFIVKDPLLLRWYRL